MTTLWEQPTTIAIAGVLTVVALLVGLLQTGSLRFLYLAIAMTCVTVGLLMVERNIITEKEQIQATLLQIAHDLESNDVQRVLMHIADANADSPIVRQAKQVLKRVDVHRVAVKRNLQVEFSPPRDPQAAHSSFNAVIVASERSGTIRNHTSPWRFEVDWIKRDGQWKVAAVKRHAPHTGLQQ